jgi:iron complex outermembrane recepter protein
MENLFMSRTHSHCAWRRVLLAALIINANAALAEDAVLAPVNVRDSADRETATSAVPGYVVKRSTTATKTDTPLIETPQAITVITADQILDQGAQNLQDALNYAAGVRSDAYGIDSRSDGARVRGSYPDEYLDGLRQAFNYYTSTTRTDPFMLERIEILRGPSAMLYGQGSTAGIVNMVSKRPQAKAQGEIGIKLGSHDLKQLQLDVTGPLSDNGEWLYRVIALGRDAGTQVDYVEDQRSLLAPSLTWQPSEQLSLTLLARWQRDKSGSTSQFLPWEGNVIGNPNGRIHTNRFIGDPNSDRYDSERATAGWLFQYELNESWTLRQNLRYTRNEVDYRTAYADSFSNPTSPYVVVDPLNPDSSANHRVIGRFASVNKPIVRMWTTDQHAEGLFKTGVFDHQLLVGIDALRFNQTEKQGSAGGPALNIDVYNPVYIDIDMPLADTPEQTQTQVGLYAQDQIKFATNWIVVAGVRHDRVKSELEDSDDNRDNATSKRLGLMYAASFGLSPYISYSESFTPLPGTDRGGSRYEPLRGKQWEAGVKYQPPAQNLNFGLAIYDLREENQQTPDPLDPNYYLQAGKTKNTGVELEGRGTFGNFEVIAHYNYTDVDEKLEALPKNQAAVWGKWNFSLADIPGFSVGTGVRYMSSFHDGVAPTTPDIALWDGLVAWDSTHWRYAINANNIADKTYYSTCLSRGDCWVGARRNIIASATYRW